MLAAAAAAASAVPRLRLAALPQPLRRPLGRSQRLLTRRRPLSSSVPNVTPAAGAGELEPPDLPRLATAARISLSPQEVRLARALFVSLYVTLAHEHSGTIPEMLMLTFCLCARSAGRGVRPQDPASGGLVIFLTGKNKLHLPIA
jgi:hypothetical protein